MTLARPKRVPRADVEETDDGLVVNTMTGVHLLNVTASVVFDLCDGTRTSDDLVEAVGQLWGLDDPPRDAVLDCLNDLRSRRVIE